MLPELAAGLDTTISTAAWSLTVYMIPFAALMILSGTLGERWGRTRTVRAAYVGYALASLLCALAPSADLFLAGRAAQGAANAFTSPLLVAAISDAVTPERLGRSLGRLGSMQAAGQAFAPLVGGAAAAVDYRWAFVASAVAAVLLGLAPPSDAPRDGARPGARPAGEWRVLANRRLVYHAYVTLSFAVAAASALPAVAVLAAQRDLSGSA